MTYSNEKYFKNTVKAPKISCKNFINSSDPVIEIVFFRHERY